jgi:hypothetical protein
MPKWSVQARDKGELLQRFEAVGIAVPPRTSGKNQDAEEMYCLRRYLLPLAEEGFLRYPLSIAKGERPDFDITWPDGSVTGLEVTKATTGEYEEDCTHFARGEDTRHYESSESMMSLSWVGWAGDSAEREWADYVLLAIKRKSKLVRSYTRVGVCDLLIYDNTPTPAPNLKRAVELLGAQRSRSPETHDGDATRMVSVIRDPSLIYDVRRGGHFLTYKS